MTKKIHRHPSEFQASAFKAKRPLPAKSLHLSPAGQAKADRLFTELKTATKK